MGATCIPLTGCLWLYRYYGGSMTQYALRRWAATVLATVFWLSFCSAHAQIDTTLRAFFPLRAGDLWEYEIDDSPSYPRFQVRNLGDTLMPNGKVYFHLQGPNHEKDDLDEIKRGKGGTNEHSSNHRNDLLLVVHSSGFSIVAVPTFVLPICPR